MTWSKYRDRSEKVILSYLFSFIWLTVRVQIFMVLPPTIRQLLRSPLSSNLPKSTTVSGWIKSIRKQKNISFAVITDGSSTKGLQAVLVKGDEDLLRRYYYVSYIHVFRLTWFFFFFFFSWGWRMVLLYNLQVVLSLRLVKNNPVSFLLIRTMPGK